MASVIAWNVDLLGGYEQEFLETREGPAQDSFGGFATRDNSGTGLRTPGPLPFGFRDDRSPPIGRPFGRPKRNGLRTWVRAETKQRSKGKNFSQIAKKHLLDRYLSRGAQFMLRCENLAQPKSSAPAEMDHPGRCDLSDFLRQDCSQTMRPPINRRHRMVNGVDAFFVVFLNQKEIVQAYAVANCLVLPSQATETWGLVVNKAMARGIPVISSEPAVARTTSSGPSDQI